MLRCAAMVVAVCAFGMLACGRPEVRSRPPEASAPPAVCADCGGRVVKFQYGLLDLREMRGRAETLRAGGKTYTLVRFDGGEFLEGGCCIYAWSPGWACIACGRVWPLFNTAGPS